MKLVLSQLQNYLEVQDSQVLGAVTVLSMLSPVGEGEEVRKYLYLDLSAEATSESEPEDSQSK